MKERIPGDIRHLPFSVSLIQNVGGLRVDDHAIGLVNPSARRAYNPPILVPVNHGGLI
jgi:hypothetical protein